ncbi:Anthranilate 1,2-dioxygenase system ferredoxin--NAD(+) reductase component [Paraburkholderia piptadeniae]|uniref:Anthranilate 1,2-dioxygenase system ferredoxin--NAD(+) reductase component n=1 Tax=Paraburkholderia piptadeniae TaxID=1701573 RepID=A0A1N7SPM6_9BURK|nr:FAD-dependent oxidoreductase [Paraburkholderia piptadeniae]SIT49292.1 Anthranilate 1,2-dioxygenase system ferredoxin--NAD(+) reductase component [Paraburkholderia piptadeniae]
MKERTNDARIVIVGAGHAGGKMAEALREAGHVGPLSLVGGESHPPYERPPLSKEMLGGESTVESTYLHPREWYASSSIALRTGSVAVELDRQQQMVHLANGDALPYDLMVMATGARARRLNVPGVDGPNIFTLRGIDDALAVRSRLVAGGRLAVVGAGFIGLEIAATARRHGMEVIVIEAALHPLARMVSSDIGYFFADLHRNEGVEVRTGVMVSSIDSDASGVRLYTDDGVTTTADIAVIGVGAVPNTELAARANLAVDDGIVVDQWGRSSDDRIFAVGDVSRHFSPFLGRHVRLESWQNAQNQPVAVARAMMGGTEPYSEVPWFWTDQYDLNIQLAGSPIQWDSVVARGNPYSPGYVHVFVADDVPVGAIAINNGRDMRFLRQMIARREKVDLEALRDPRRKLQEIAALASS